MASWAVAARGDAAPNVSRFSASSQLQIVANGSRRALMLLRNLEFTNGSRGTAKAVIDEIILGVDTVAVDLYTIEVVPNPEFDAEMPKWVPVKYLDTSVLVATESTMGGPTSDIVVLGGTVLVSACASKTDAARLMPRV